MERMTPLLWLATLPFVAAILVLFTLVVYVFSVIWR